MKNTRIIILLIGAVLTNTPSSFGKLSKDEKNLCQKWKLWKVEEMQKEVEPTNARYIIDIKKNKTFSIMLNYEIAYRGNWEYSRKTLILHDKVTNKDIIVPIIELDHTHLVVKDLEGIGKNTFMTPLSHKDAEHLTHSEHLLVKKWTIYQSSNESLVGSLYDFHENKTFDYYYSGQSVPISSGTWSISKNAKYIVLEPKRSETSTWDVLELHRHELVVKSQFSGNTNKMHDPYLTEKDGLDLFKETTKERE